MHAKSSPDTARPSILAIPLRCRSSSAASITTASTAKAHLWNPTSISRLQHAVLYDDQAAYDEYAQAINDQSRELCTLRGLFEFEPGQPVPLDEVEPASAIIKRFYTGAMSHGSISREAHETMAIAMNRVGASSNTGERG